MLETKERIKKGIIEAAGGMLARFYVTVSFAGELPKVIDSTAA
jgi:hypothetical protein